MRTLPTSVLALGIATAAAIGQAPAPLPPRPLEMPDLKQLMPSEVPGPETLELIGKPISTPPVTSWPVGKAVTEFDSGTVYVYWLYDPTSTCSPAHATSHHRHYFGQLAGKHADRLVVVEVLTEDRRQTTLADEWVDSVAQDPFVRSRVGVCESRAFEDWCGSRRSACNVLAVVVDSRGRLATVTDEYADVPFVVGKLIDGTFDHAAYLDTVRKWKEVMYGEGREQREGRIEQLEQAYQLLPCRYADTEIQRSRLLIALRRSEEAAAAIRRAIDHSTPIDRRFLQDVVSLAETVQGWGEAMRPIMLDAAKMLAATSDHQSYRDLKQAARIAGTLRDFDTAISYQTMAVSRAREGSQRDEAVAKLREYEAAKEKK